MELFTTVLTRKQILEGTDSDLEQLTLPLFEDTNLEPQQLTFTFSFKKNDSTIKSN